jgi:hypothetical protein
MLASCRCIDEWTIAEILVRVGCENRVRNFLLDYLVGATADFRETLMIGTTKTIAVLGCLFVLCAGTPGLAGVLNDHADAYDNNLGPGTGGRWAGTAPFTDGFNLSGTVDFAVFTAQAFNDNFSGLGYAPTDALVYAYQVFNTGTDVISGQLVGVVNDAQDIGQFDIGDVAASGMAFIPGAASWEFTLPPILPGESSWGLSFSSGNIPELGTGLTLDSGSAAFEMGLPTPSAIPIPEPASILLWCLSSGLIMFFRRNRG